MPFTFLNDPETSAPSDQIEPDARDFEIMLAGLSGTASSGNYGAGPTGVQSQTPTTNSPGCAVTAQGIPDQTVAVAAGTVRIGGRRVAVTAGNASLSAADATNPRIDLITVDMAGTLAATAGTASADPVYPTLPVGKIILAQVYRAPNDNTIQTADITDKRVVIEEPPHEDVRWYGARGDDSTNNATALQAALDAAADAAAGFGRGRTVWFPHGIYRTATALTMYRGLKLLGDGQPGPNSAYGSWLSGATNGMTILNDPEEAGVSQEGWTVENLGFCDAGTTGITGLKISGTNNWHVDHCIFFSNGDGNLSTGMYLDAGVAGNLDNNYNFISFTDFKRVTVGVDAFVGVHMICCNYIPSTTMTTGAIGIRMKSSGTDTAIHAQNARIIGSEFLVPSNGIGVLSQGSIVEMVGNHFEAIPTSTSTTGLKLEKVAGSNVQAGSRHNISSASFTNFTTAINVGTNVTDTAIIATQNTGNTTNLTDNGTRTLYLPNTSGEIARLAVALDWPQVTAPVSPASGFHRFYVDSADTTFKSKNSAGTISVYGARTRALFFDGSILRLDAAAGVRMGTPPNVVDGVALVNGVTSGAYFNFLMPVDVITGTVTIRPIWIPGASTAALTVRWQMNIKIITAADVTAAGTALDWTGDSATRTQNVEVMESGSPSTAVSPAANDRVRLEIQRLGAHASDTYTGDVNLIGVRIDYSANN